MKRYYIVGGAILGFFLVIALLMKTIGNTKTASAVNEKQGRINKAINTLVGQADNSTIKFKAEKAPTWGSLKAVAQPKTEQSYTFNGGNAGMKQDKKADAKDKKKKKKSKKAKKKKTNVIVHSIKKNKTASNTSDSDMSGSGGYGGSPVATAKPKDPNALPETLEEWEAYLLNPPNKQHLAEFIKYYQAKLIKDDIYFPLCEKMVAAPLEQVRHFGVIALGSAPSVQSFYILNQAILNERSGNIIALIDSSFQTYQSVQFVNYMAPSLDSTAERVRYQAALTIDSSARMNIHRTETTDPQDPRGGRTGVDIVNARVYQVFIPRLTVLVANEPNESVRDAARQALSTLTDLLAPSPTQASN